MTFVLDASAVLALINEEPGGVTVRERLDDALMSTVNLIEVVTKLIDNGMPPEVARLTLELLELETAALDAELAYGAAALREGTRARGLSLADRVCLALAAREGATAITADRAWAETLVPCKVEIIR